MTAETLEQYVDTRLDTSELLRLTLPASSLKAYLIEPDYELEVAGRRYRIAEREDDRDGEVATISVEAEALWYELADELTPGTFTLTDVTPADGYAAIMARSSWTMSDDPAQLPASATTYNLELTDNSTLDLLRAWATLTGTHLRFDTVNRAILPADLSGRDLGLGFRYRRNVEKVRRRARPPAVTVLYPYGRDDLTVAGINGGQPFLEDFTYYTGQGLTLAEARARFTKTRVWSDTSIVDEDDLLAAATIQLDEQSQAIVTYELKVLDLRELTGVDDPVAVGDTVRVHDPEFGQNLRTTVVRTVIHPLEPDRNIVELAYLPRPIQSPTQSPQRSDRSLAWILFTGPTGSTYPVRNDGVFITNRIPLRFGNDGREHVHLDLELVGVGAGTATVDIHEAESDTVIWRTLDIPYTDGAVVNARASFAVTDLAGAVDYRVRVTTLADGGASPSAGVDVTGDNDGEAAFYILAQDAVQETPTLDNSIRYDYTGAIQTFTVPDSVTEVTVDVNGAAGHAGGDGAGGGAGGRVKFTMSVTPGTLYDVHVGGGAGTTSSAGWPNGGAGAPTEGGGGGGSSHFVAQGGAFASSIAVAAGGGGEGEKRVGDAFSAGGAGGFLTGGDGIDGDTGTTGGKGGAGATQTAGGTGGTGGSPAAEAGTFNQGGAAAGSDAFQAEAGGGGGGWYGGGGGAGTSTGSGGGGGGSGYLDSSVAPFDIELVDGANAGAGYVEISWQDPIA